MPKNNPKPGFFVKNILVIGHGEQSLGLTKTMGSRLLILNDGKKDLKRTQRILKHIASIADFAKKNHNVNRLTRIVTDEFSFYTRSTPLSLAEYKFIINSLSTLLKSLPPNIILIISSMPVIWSDGTLRNAVLHIQSPNNNHSLPLIHHISKEHLSNYDPLYDKQVRNTVPKQFLPNLYKFAKDDYSCKRHSPNAVLKDTSAICNDPYQYKSAIIVRSHNLPLLIDTIDICLDHQEKIALDNVTHLLKKNSLTQAPFHINHIITSRVIDSIKDNLAASPIHADEAYREVGNTPCKSACPLTTYFGQDTTAYIYHQTRVELLHSHHFDTAAEKYNQNLAKLPIHSIVDNYNNTLLHQIFLKNKKSDLLPYFMEKRFYRTIPYFRIMGINKKNNDGDTALHLAISTTSKIDIIQSLIIHGARLDIQNNSGISPIKAAYVNNKNDIIFFLLKILIKNNINLPDSVYIELIIEELQCEPANIKVIALALSRLTDLTMLNQLYGTSQFSIAEKLLSQAYVKHDAALLANLKNSHPSLFTAKTVNKIAMNFPNESVAAQEWLSSEIIKNELNLGRHANINNLLTFLPHLKNINEAFKFTSLTVGEQLIAQAYIVNNPLLLKATYENFTSLFNIKTLNNVINFFAHHEKARKWFSVQVYNLNYPPLPKTKTNFGLFQLDAHEKNVSITQETPWINKKLLIN